VPHVAVFDTAFHAGLPRGGGHVRARRLAGGGARDPPVRLSRHLARVRRRPAAHLLGRPLAELNLVVLHLGNGASACAVAGGRSVETSMGMTPLEGW
jgi:acetate kinase